MSKFVKSDEGFIAEFERLCYKHGRILIAVGDELILCPTFKETIAFYIKELMADLLNEPT